MNLLKLESHIFINNLKEPSTADMSELINAYSGDELLPQYFEEQILSTSKRVKRLMFLNPMEAKSVRYMSNRLLISKEVNPFGSDLDLEISLNDFREFTNRCLDIYEKHFEIAMSAHRASLVLNFITQITPETKEKFSKKIVKVFPWESKNFVELKFRVGDVVDLTMEKKVNVIMSIDDGVVEKNTNGQMSSRDECFITQFDISTDSDNKHGRITKESHTGLIKEMGSIIMDRTAHLKEIFQE
ncbi:hypothetical protein [Pseudoalteromonas sp. Z1A2]|uniref:hypothetical protein n=1 Tax=Pseudoalteromonas sp. Z1A2 TaxID=2686350 RepID=UPI0013FE4590|nr:hypothetical protein [Pseudoalteromonas sp. Z1A2]